MTLEQAIEAVNAGQLGRVCNPGKWRVWRDDDGEIIIESFAIDAT